MSADAVTLKAKRRMRWTRQLIRRLRGKRTQAQFGSLIGAPKNTVWRWESGQSRPDASYSRRLSELAAREHFLQNWKLAGSMKLAGELESAGSKIAARFRRSLERTSRELGG
jgi:transcriptional regulator with XRE-family HTH domain